MTDPQQPSDGRHEGRESDDPQPPEPSSEHPVLAAGRFASDQTSASVIAYLITGPAVFGGLGLLLDRWLGTGFLVVLGLLGGMALSLYVIWLRYGTP
ncbi:AtpZ/AtpI family protein [Intrasporangium sp.]|uniref:AtpZ/AtpI family protein n=1 Tax=Intrasporangium sp. TaxID=1925024 RepID=UPI00293AE997|nr:AtpZ/AtpI family protein [Intrasporangium sp.]MDV3222556.1 AtpZ/AtpI family protein [Intrasporangium sp.]